jgi:hypothetical protein
VVFTAIAVALALGGGAGWLRAQAAQGKGSVSGVVLTADGKPMVGLALRLERTEPHGAGDGAGSKRKRAAGWDNGATGLQGGKEKGVKIVGRGTTDQNGKFHIQNVDPGGAILVGGSKNQGWIYYPCEIKAGEETKLEPIKMAKQE